MGRRRSRPEPQPGEHRRGRRRIRPRHRRGRRARHRRRQGRLPGLEPLRPLAAPRGPEEGRRRDPRPQGRARPPALPRGRQNPCRRRRRDHPRRADLRVLRRRDPAPHRRDRPLGPPRRRRRDHPRGDRPGRDHHPLELPDRDPGLEDRAGAGLGQHRRHQARRPRPRLHLGDRRHPAPRGPAEGRPQPRDGPRLDRRPGAPRQPRHPRHQLHRVAEHRPPRRRGLDQGDAQVPARDGRQEPDGRPRRRRPRGRGRGLPQRRLLLHRPALHRELAPDRHRRHPRPLRRPPQRADGCAQGRRPARRFHPDRPGRRPEPARPGRRATSSSAPRRAPSSSAANA